MSFIQQFFTSRDNNANAETFVGQEGRLWWNPETNQIYSSDGNTPGGIPLAGGGGGNGTPGGSNSQVQFNQAGSFGGTANVTIDRVTGTLTAVSFVGNGVALTSITGANVTGIVANATYADSAGSATTSTSATTAGTVTTNAQPNITSVGTLTSLSSTGNISGNYFIGNGSLLTGIAAGTYGNTNVASYLASGTNSSNIVTTANISAGNISGTHYGNGAGLSSITAANVIGTVGAANVANVANYATTANSASFADQATYVYGNGVVGQVAYAAVANSVAGANVSGAVANATYALSANSASSLVNGSAVVLLNSDGTMVFPNNNINSGSNPITLWSTDSSSLLWRDAAGGAPSEPVQTIIEAGNGVATITVSTGVLAVQSQKIWTFNTTGNIVFPDSTVQTTAYPGNANTLSLIGNITGGNVTGTTSVAVGGTGGDLTMTGGAITGVGNITSNGIMAINAPGGITTTAGSFDIVNATATTVNIGGSATAVNIGATTGTLTINNPNIVATQASIAVFNTTATAANIFGAASTIIMGAAGAGTLTLRNGTIVGSQTTQNLFNTVATTVNFAGAANTLAIAAGATPSGTTKTIGIGENGVANSITNINLGTATGNGNVTFSANTLVRVANTSGTALSVAGNITGGNIMGGANVNATTHTGTTASLSGNVTGGNVIATTTVYGNAATAFVAGSAAISGVALQMPQEGALRNLNNGLTNMYFDVSIGGTTNGQFQFRSSSSFTNVLTMSPTAFNVNTEAVVTAKTASFGRLPWNSALDTELTIDDYRWRITNSGGIYPQVISNTGGTKNSAWTAVAAISGQAVAQGGSTGVLVANNAWTSLYTFASMNSAGDTVTVTFQDKNLGRIYRITFMRSDNGSTTGYNIIAERLI